MYVFIAIIINITYCIGDGIGQALICEIPSCLHSAYFYTALHKYIAEISKHIAAPTEMPISSYVHHHKEKLVRE